MKNIVLAVITMTLTTFNLMSQDFRNATWCMSLSQVKSIETSTLVQANSNMLKYPLTLVGLDAYAIYSFADDKLTSAYYIMDVKHSNNNDYISEYNMLNDILKKKYGEPLEDKAQWISNSENKDDMSSWGHSIWLGELELYAIYRTSNSEIKIVLYSVDHKAKTQILYSSTDAELKNLEEKKLLKDF